jgi:hypothetical protein
MEIGSEVISRGRLDITSGTHAGLQLDGSHCGLWRSLFTSMHIFILSEK